MDSKFSLPHVAENEINEKKTKNSKRIVREIHKNLAESLKVLNYKQDLL